LEFDLVFVPGLEDGLFPSGKSIDERNGLEEERRLMYVAITRAKKQLVLSSAKTRYVFGDYQMQMPSRFLKELPQLEIEFEEVSYGSNYLYNKRSETASPTRFIAPNWQKSSAPVAMVSTTYSKAKIDDGMSGKRVFHQKFGYGKVTNVDGNKLEIAFEKSGTKTVIKDFVSLA
jgi:DNA helicase-2/ATP-dependent DNA helicase PcrA